MTREELELRLTQLVEQHPEAMDGDVFIYQWVPMADVEEMDREELLERCGMSALVHLGRMSEVEYEEWARKRYGWPVDEEGGRMESEAPEQPAEQPAEETPAEAPAEQPAEGEPSEAPSEGESEEGAS